MAPPWLLGGRLMLGRRKVDGGCLGVAWRECELRDKEGGVSGWGDVGRWR